MISVGRSSFWMTFAIGEGLARAGHAEKRLVAISGLDRLQQFCDRLPLIAAWSVVRFELEGHRPQ